jgi:hypothetical protein
MTGDLELADLQSKWPHWQIWIVPTFDGTRSGKVWCARPLGELRPVLNEYSASGLDAAISDTEPC